MCVIASVRRCVLLQVYVYVYQTPRDDRPAPRTYPPPTHHNPTYTQACLRLQRRYDEEYSALWATPDMEAHFQVPCRCSI